MVLHQPMLYAGLVHVNHPDVFVSAVSVIVFRSCPAFRLSLAMSSGGRCGPRRWGGEGVKRQILFYIALRNGIYTGRRAYLFFHGPPTNAEDYRWKNSPVGSNSTAHIAHFRALQKGACEGSPRHKPN